MGDGDIFDSILGREKLKDEIEDLKRRISQLEDEKADLNDRIDEIESKKKEAITEKQEAYREKNKMQDKVVQLEDKIDKIESQRDDNIESEQVINTFQMREIEGLVRALKNVKYKNRSARTVSILEKKDLMDKLSSTDINVSGIDMKDLVLIDDYGIIRCSLELPIPYNNIDHKEKTFTIQEEKFLPNDDYYFGVLRSDTFAIGRYEKWSRVGIRSVKSRVGENHSKGGFSQSRFENLRDEQIDKHIDEVRDTIKDFCDKDLRIIIVGEDRILDRVDDLANHTDTSDATGSPTDSLEEAFSKFWTVKIKDLS